MALGPRIGPRRNDERDYESVLRRGVLDRIVVGLEGRLSSAVSWTQVEAEIAWRATLRPEQWEQLDETARRAATNHVNRVHDWHTARFASAMRRFIGVRVDYLSDPVIGPLLADRIAENVNLIKTIPERYHASLTRHLMEMQRDKPFNERNLKQLLRREYQSSGYNLRRIARDQTSKMVGQLNEERQKEVGIEEYIWETSQDDRVRITHQMNSGRRVRWDDPPTQTGHPGEDIQCRCIARAIVPGFTPVETQGPASLIV